MVSQYSVISDPFTAPTKPAANKQASQRQDASASSFETHLRNQDRQDQREAARQRDDRQTLDRDTRTQARQAANDDRDARETARETRSSDQARQDRDLQRSNDGIGNRTDDRRDATLAQQRPASDDSASSVTAEPKPAPRAENQTEAQSSDGAVAQTEETATSATAAPTEPSETQNEAVAVSVVGQSKDANLPDETAETGPVKLADALQGVTSQQGEKVETAPQSNSNLNGTQSLGDAPSLPQPQGQSQSEVQGQNQAPLNAQKADQTLAQPTMPTQNQAETQQQANAAAPVLPANSNAETAALTGTEKQTSDTEALRSTVANADMPQTGGVDANMVSKTEQPASDGKDLEAARPSPATPAGGQPSDGIETQTANANGAAGAILDETSDPITQSVSSHQTGASLADESTAPILQTGQTQDLPEGSSELADDHLAKMVNAKQQDGTQQALNQSVDQSQGQPVSQTSAQDATQGVPPHLAQQTAQVQDTVRVDAGEQGTNSAKQAGGAEQSQNQTQAALSALAQGKERAEQGMKEAQQAASSGESTSSDTSDAADEPARPKAVNPLTVATTENGALRQAPKADAFTKMMAGITNQASLQDAAMQSDPTLKVDAVIPTQGDGSTVRLTGMESFARTGHVPQQAAAANAQAMAAQISKFAQRGETRFEIRLDPADLGKVDVRLTIGSDGQTRAHLFVERPETLDMFMRDQRIMERSLLQSGLNLDKQGLEFSLMDQQDSGQQMAQDQQESTEEDLYGSNRQSQAASEERTDPAVLQPTHSGSYVASTGVNLVI